VFRQIESGLASSQEELVLRRRDLVPGTGVLKDLAPASGCASRTRPRLMVTVTGNVATNLLIEAPGHRRHQPGHA